MTFQITKSAVKCLSERGIVPDFAAAVDRHIVELRAHYQHHETIKSQPVLPKYPEFGEFIKAKNPQAEFQDAVAKWAKLRLSHHDPYPRPSAHPYIDQAVRFDGKDFVTDYEVVNDDPSPEQVLRAKKDDLLHQIAEAEAKAKAGVELSPGKARLAALIDADILRGDAAVTAELRQKELERQLAWQQDVQKKLKKDPSAKIDDFVAMSAEELQKEVLRRRTEGHAQHLQAQQSRQERLDAIVRDAAHAMSDVEDLTAETIDSYKVPTL